MRGSRRGAGLVVALCAVVIAALAGCSAVASSGPSVASSGASVAPASAGAPGALEPAAVLAPVQRTAADPLPPTECAKTEPPTTSGADRPAAPGAARALVPFVPSAVLVCAYQGHLVQPRLVTDPLTAWQLADALDSGGAPWGPGAYSCPAVVGPTVVAEFSSASEVIPVVIDTSGCRGASNGWRAMIGVFGGAVATRLHALVGAAWGH